MKLAEVTNEYKNQCLEIVQKYIDSDCDTESLLLDCAFITRAHYDDITEERACTDLCGYVFCNNRLQNTTKKSFKESQKYHIKHNKVYDITRRKNFCSDLCFKSSVFLQNQISTEPLYLRKENLSNCIQLYQEKAGQVGDEVTLKEVITKDEVEQSVPKPAVEKPVKKEDVIMKASVKVNQQNISKQEKRIEKEITTPYLKEETFNELKEQFRKLTIEEKNISLANQGHKQTKQPICDYNHDVNYLLRKEFQNKQDLLEDIDNVTVTSATTTGSTRSRKRISSKRLMSELMSRLRQWITVDTKRLLNIPLEESGKLSIRFDNPEEDAQSKIEKYRWEYIRLCAKLNQEEIEDEKYDQMVIAQSKNMKKIKTNLKKRSNVLVESNQADVHDEFAAFFKGKFFPIGEEQPKKKVAFKEEVEKKETEETKEESSKEVNDEENEEQFEEKLFTPLVESLRPDLKRKQIFLKEIDDFLCEIFDGQLELMEVSALLENIRKLVETFQLTVDNMVLGKKYNYLLSIILLRTLLIFQQVDYRYEKIFESNLFIANILKQFHLDAHTLDGNIFEVFNFNSI